MMEMRRTFIIIAIAVVSYLMLLAWQKDYGPKPEPEVAATAATATANKPVADVPSAAAPVTAANSDIPVAPQKVDVAPTTSNTSSTSLIRISSDVLNIAIDPVGGDVVEVTLPKHAKHINSKQPFVLLENNRGRTYVAQSGLVGANGPDAGAARPHYSSASQQYVLEKGDQVQAVLSYNDAKTGAQIEKIYTLKRGSYLVDVSYRITNRGTQNWNGVMFGQLKRDASTDPSASTSSMGLVTYLGAAYWNNEKPYNKLAFDEFEEKPLKQTVKGGWAAIVQHYFVAAWVPGKNEQNTFTSRVKKEQNEHIIGYTSPDIQVIPNTQKTVSASLYVGPKIQESLKAISPGLELTVDYGILWPISQFLFWLLNFIHSFVSNWGWSIIGLTIVVKLAFWHLSATSYRSMANMRRVAPELQRMKELYGDDRQKMSQAMMDMYRKEKINPLGGCLPMLVQMPVFIALYWTLVESVELRHAGFLLWIKDLAAMDPYYVLPLLMGASMVIQSRLNPEPPDPMQAKMMKIMPVIFTVFFLWFPSGLVLYWLVSNIISILQQWYITRQIEGAAAAKK